MKELWKKFKEVVYIITILGMGCGWYISSKLKTERDAAREVSQEAQLRVQDRTIDSLNRVIQKQEVYNEGFQTSIDWLAAIAGIDVE